MSSAVRAFFTQIVNTTSIPLSFDYERPNEESLRAIRETEGMKQLGNHLNQIMKTTSSPATYF